MTYYDLFLWMMNIVGWKGLDWIGMPGVFGRVSRIYHLHTGVCLAILEQYPM